MRRRARGGDEMAYEPSGFYLLMRGNKPARFCFPARALLQRLVAVCRLLPVLLLVLAPAGCSEEPAQPNIILVILDTVRNDFTGPGGNQSGLTPQLDELAAGGTVFRNAWATAPWTLPVHASIFTGMLPSGHGCNINHWRFDEKHRTAAAILGRAGYETAAFYSNPWLSDRLTGVLHGFELRRESPLGGAIPMSTGRSDQGGASSNQDISQWLDQRPRPKPFFLFVNYLEAHLPYDPPADYREEHLADLPLDDVVSIAWSEEFNAGLHPSAAVDWERVRRLYGGDVNHVDRLLAGLIKMLKDHGVYEHSIIIVTSDHGENLGEHGLMEHQYSVHETLLSVPLVIRAPKRLMTGVRNEPVMLIDLFATILESAGVRGEDIPANGRSLFSIPGARTNAAGGTDRGDRLLVAEYGGGHPSLVNSLRALNPNLDPKPFQRGYGTVRRGDFRLTVGTDSTVWLHNTAADPAQKVNIAREHPQMVEELYTAMSEAIRTEVGKDSGGVGIDAESLRKLRSLGYIR